MRIIRAASASHEKDSGDFDFFLSPRDFASAAALTAELFAMRSLVAVNAVLAALGRATVTALDISSLKAAGWTPACCKAVGFDLPPIKAAGFTAEDFENSGCDIMSAQAAGYSAQSLADAFGYEAVKAAGCDVGHVIQPVRLRGPSACAMQLPR
jgi:hypothetical protein